MKYKIYATLLTILILLVSFLIYTYTLYFILILSTAALLYIIVAIWLIIYDLIN